MRSSRPKVLHELLGEPLIFYVLREALSLKKQIDQIIVVLGYKGKEVAKKIKADFPNIEFVYQKKLSGTADAAKAALKKVKNKKVLILCADAPLIRAKTLLKLIRKKTSAGVITACISGGNSLGGVVRDRRSRLMAIAEKLGPACRGGSCLAGRQARTAPTEEINSGIYCFDKSVLLSNLRRIRKNPKKGEYFLTDLARILYDQARPFVTFRLNQAQEVLGINTNQDLERCGKIMQKRIIEALISKGVRIIDPDSIRIESGVKIGKNTLIYPFTYIEKGVIIGSDCSLGPFLHLRGNTSVGEGSCLGNFLELNRCKVGKRVKIKHFGYLGDAEVADGVNIGAGTVIANYDGKHKHKTHIAKGAFIGCDSILVAPVNIGKGAVTGAGCVVTKNVKAGSVVTGVPAKLLRYRK